MVNKIALKAKTCDFRFGYESVEAEDCFMLCVRRALFQGLWR